MCSPASAPLADGFKVCVCLAILGACSTLGQRTHVGAPGAPSEAELDLAGMDRSVPPGQDFYRYANGEWQRTAEIPPDRSSIAPDRQVQERVLLRTRAIVEEAVAAKAAAGSELRKIGDTYASFMDEAAVESMGLEPLRPELARIAALADRRALAEYLGGTVRANVDPLNAGVLYTDRVLGLWAEQDLADPSRTAAYLLQGGLGFPDRSYYLDDTPEALELRAAYRAHLARVIALAHLASDETGDTMAERVLEFETRLARSHASAEDSGDLEKGNNPFSRKELEARAPGMDWGAFLGAAGLDRQPGFIVWQPSAVIGLAALVAEIPLPTWREYLAVRAVERASPYLSRAFVEERFAFYEHELEGKPRLPDRWKRGLRATEAALGPAIGHIYVARHFPPEVKVEIEEMVRNIKAAFAVRIDALTWLSEQTKAEAREKLAAMRVGIGYPDRWPDMSGLKVVRGDLLGNVERAELFWYRRALSRLGRPPEREEWISLPQTVNAFNLPIQNRLEFCAGAFEPPLYDRTATAAARYGGTGWFIGHEITHGFDSGGAKLDAQGRFRTWWTLADLERFTSAGAALVSQYDGYRPFPDLAVNGKLTLAENIADLGGVAATYDAWRASLQGAEPAMEGGLTGPQQFFVAFAQSFRLKAREEVQRLWLRTDGHAPDRYRALTVRNLDAWYDAFHVQPGQDLWLAPEDRVRIW